MSSAPIIDHAVDYELEVSSITFDNTSPEESESMTSGSDEPDSQKELPSLTPHSSTMIQSKEDESPRTLLSSRIKYSRTPATAVRPVVKPYAVIKKKRRFFSVILGHWDGGSSSDKPRVILDRSKKPPVPGAIVVGGPDSFLASGGYYDPYVHVHHQTFPNIIKKTTNGIREDSRRYSYQGMFRWFFVHFEDVESPDLADWSQWVRYDMLYDSVDALVHYYSTSPTDYTKNWAKMAKYKAPRRKRNNW